MPGSPKALFDSVRPKKKRKEGPSEEVVDQRLDDALKSLARATRRNTEAGERVRMKKSSGRLKLVSAPPGE